MLGRADWRLAIFAMMAFAATSLVGCQRPQARQVIEIAVQCPHATASQVERQVTMPIEMALNGLPGVDEVSAISSPGRSRVYLVLIGRPGSSPPPAVIARVQGAGPFSLHTSPPQVREIAAPPAVADGPTIEVLEIQPIAAALAKHGLEETALWKLIAEGCDADASIDERERRLAELTVLIGDAQVPLAQLVTIERKQAPAALGRIQGFSAAKYNQLNSKP